MNKNKLISTSSTYNWYLFSVILQQSKLKLNRKVKEQIKPPLPNNNNKINNND